jgi:aspartate/methionine/tyrosine aminotransferase
MTAHVVVTAGIQENRFFTIQILGDQAGHIGLPEVVHPGVRMAAGVRPLEVKTVSVDAEHGYLPTPAALRAAIRNGCSLVYIESPALRSKRSRAFLSTVMPPQSGIKVSLHG